MILPGDLTADQRDRIRVELTARIAQAQSEDWRALWEAELLFMNGDNEDALIRLARIVASADRNVAVSALLVLGDWHEFSGARGLARKAYGEAIEIGGEPSVLARTKLARLHNTNHEPKLAVAVLENAVADIENVAADFVQFVVAEYAQALRTLGRTDDARTLISRATKSFPDRAEIALISRHLLGE